MAPAADPPLDRIELRPIGHVRTAYPGAAWLDQIRGGWYQQHDVAADPLVRPTRQGLRGVGLDPASIRVPANDQPREDTMQLSARNQLTGTVASVELGAVMAEVTVDVAGQQIVSAITRSSAERLGLAQGQPVTVFIKATEVILGVDD
jgi:molybdopterin-binding protein